MNISRSIPAIAITATLTGLGLVAAPAAAAPAAAAPAAAAEQPAFADPALARCVDRSTWGDPNMQQWLSSLSCDGVTSLDGIQQLSQLRGLTLSNSHIDDLAPIGDLPILNQLLITDSTVGDLSVLSGMPELEGLAILNTPLSTVQLGEIAAHPRYTSVNLSNAGLADITPLANLTLEGDGQNLTGLYLGGNQIVDVSPLEHVRPNLLDLSRNRITDVGPLAPMQPASLDLTDNKISDATPLAQMTGWLELDRNELIDISMLSADALISAYDQAAEVHARVGDPATVAAGRHAEPVALQDGSTATTENGVWASDGTATGTWDHTDQQDWFTGTVSITVAPGQPVAPGEPIVPTVPGEPGGSVEPVGPTAPSEPGGSVETAPSEPAAPVESESAATIPPTTPASAPTSTSAIRPAELAHTGSTALFATVAGVAAVTVLLLGAGLLVRRRGSEERAADNA